MIPPENVHTIIIRQAANGWTITTIEAPTRPSPQQRIAKLTESQAWSDDKGDIQERMLLAVEKMTSNIERMPADVMIGGYPNMAPVTHVALDADSALKRVKAELTRLELGDEVDQQLRALLGGASS